MSAKRYCEVALPVPLRTTFTYAIPDSLRDEDLIGRRLLVPFRNRAMVGVGLALSDKGPTVAQVKEISGLLDRVPALPTKLIELGHWISRYYIAPIGETFRAMLPPEIELRHDREYSLTDAGRAYLQDLAASSENTDVESSELEFLRGFEGAAEKAGAVQSAAVRRLPGAEALAEKLVRRGYLSAREIAHRRKTRTQKIIAWNPAKDEPSANSAEEKIREVLTATRGPLPSALLMKKAEVSRAVILRLEKQGRLLIGRSHSQPRKTPGIPISLRPQMI
jgi:primosomal protein N'